MWILLLALMFAAVLASATLVSTDKEVLAQEPVHTVLIRKMVGEVFPDSGWDLGIGVYGEQTDTTIASLVTCARERIEEYVRYG